MTPPSSRLSYAGAVLLALLLIVGIAQATVPSLLNHQGRVSVNGSYFQGTGQFKFALVDTTGTTTYWSNDGSSTAGSQPSAAVSLAVVNGIYSVLLGDVTLTNMTAVPATAFSNSDVRLRVWFNDGSNGFQLITPDQRLAAAAYAMVASQVDQTLLSSLLAPPVYPVLAWGSNQAGQTTVPALSNVTAVAGGAAFSLALLKSGTVTAWGTGVGTSVPVGLAGVTSISAASAHALARMGDGTVAAWGDNSYGQSTVPGGTSNVIQVAAGDAHSLVLLGNGTVTGWGDNSFGQLTIPGGLSNVVAIAAGYDHNLALTASGTVMAWGRGTEGQTTVPGLTNVIAIGAGAFHSLAVQSDGTVVAWGLNNAGQSTVPAGLAGVTKVTGGYGFSMALKSDGTLAVWGDNSYGQTTIPSSAAQLSGIAAGYNHALVLRAPLVPAPVARLDQANTFTASVGILRAPATNQLEVQGTASKSTAGSWLANSDRRIKTEVRPLTHALEKLDQVRLVDFRYTDEYRASHPEIDGKRYLNVIAQEFAKVFPDHVKSSREKLPDGSEILQVDTYPLTIYSAAAVQELHAENEALKKQLSAQEERLRKLEAVLNK